MGSEAIAEYKALGVPDGIGWVVAWRLASLGDVNPGVAAAAAYSINPGVIGNVMKLYQDVTDVDSILAVRDAAVQPGLDEIAPGLSDGLAELAEPLWRGVDAIHFGARPMFAAHRELPRPEDMNLGVVGMARRQLPARAARRQSLGAVRERRPR